jgi:hypothetical protein
MLGLKSFGAARCRMAGIAVRHALGTGQVTTPDSTAHTPAAPFSALAASIKESDDSARFPSKLCDSTICGGVNACGLGRGEPSPCLPCPFVVGEAAARSRQ